MRTSIPKRKRPALGVLLEREFTMKPGPQWKTDLGGMLFRIYFTRHFVERFYYDDEDRPAVTRVLDEDTIHRVISQSLPEIKDLIEREQIAEGILVSEEYGLSMKFFTVPTREGWRLDFATMIVGAPLWRTSDREVLVKVNPILPVRFDSEVPEKLQAAVIAEILPALPGLEVGEVEHVGGEIAEATVERRETGFMVSNAEWTARI